MEPLPTPLVDADWLARYHRAVRLLDCRVGPDAEARFAAGHLPGAVWADLERDLSAPGEFAVGGRHPLPSLEDWCATLGRWGVGPETLVVAYDDRGGMLAAARAWWMVRAVGHDAVAVLDGGLQAAFAAGLAPTAEPPTLEPRLPYPASAWRLPTVNAGDVEAHRTAPAHRLIDVRAAERFAGEVEPIDPIAGHIPGAINLPCAAQLQPDGRFRPAAALRAELEQALGDVPPSRAILQCGSGVTACHTLLGMAHAGLDGAALYVGSWSEWCRSDRPREPDAS